MLISQGLMFYLQHNNVRYYLNPEQSFSHSVGNPNMRTCFDNIKAVDFPEPIVNDEEQLNPLL